MPLTNASIPVDATWAPTGGTARTLTLLSASVAAASYLIDDGALFPLRKKVNVSIVEPRPKADAPAGYTQRRARVNIQVPVEITTGVYTTNSITVELSCDPATLAASITSLRSLAVNALNDADFDALWKNNSVG
jgi:hypothetical protein